MNADTYRYPDAPHAAEACAKYILERLEEASAGDKHATLAVSGGSSPRLMFEIFARTPFPWERVELFWVDERAVPPTDAQSNFKLANDNWLAAAHFPNPNIHRIQAELAPEAAALRYSEELGAYFGGMPHFDVIHRGMGPDAHTASLFPGEPMIDDRSGYAAAVWVEKMGQWRITLLPGVLLAARHTVMLVTGADKAEPLHQVFQEPYDPKKYPAQLNSHATWFLDDAAAAKID
jgi:6-phosphogluconolactonase